MPLSRTLADLADDARKNVEELDAAELSQLLGRPGEPLVIDVREADEWQRGRLPGAVHIPRGVLEGHLVPRCFGAEPSEEDLRRAIVCYCGGGFRSLLAAEQLKKMGFENARSLRGGFRGWIQARGPVEGAEHPAAGDPPGLS